MSTSSPVTISGTYSGLNVNAIIQAITAADSIPITQLQDTNSTLTKENSDITSLGTSLGTLSSQLQSLGSNSLFSSKLATVGTTSVGTASVDATAAVATTSITITKLATNTILTGGLAGGAFSDAKLTAPPAGSTLVSNALNETSVAGQTFTINGKQITLSDIDFIDNGNPTASNSVIGKINSSGAGVTATYDSTTGKISLVSNTSSPIILGSGGDTSDFLHQAGLFNNGSTSVTSVTGLGRINPNVNLATAGLRTPLTAGTFTVNGISITYNAGDTLNNLIGNINSSKAGVTASYDTYSDQIVLTSNTRGPQNITVANGTGNIATALRLTAADSKELEGDPTLFTVGNSTTVRQSDSNILTSSDLGVQGLTFTATATGTTNVTVSPDTATIASAINTFITQYNATQTVINTDTYEDTGDPSKNGKLAGVNALTFLPFQLRSSMTNSVNSSATIRMLSDLGIKSNANDNQLTQVDTTSLANALTNHLSDVEALFNDNTYGLVNTVQSVLNNYNNSLTGVLGNLTKNNTSQISYNNNLISTMQEQIAAETTALQNEFAALDSAQASGQALSAVLTGNTSSSSITTSAGSVGGTSSSTSTTG